MKTTILKQIENWLQETLGETGVVSFNENLLNGDVSTNVGIKNKNASELLEKLKTNKRDFISEISIAGPGFINFLLSDELLVASCQKKNEAQKILPAGEEKVIVEYTDPNVMKPFHVGHLMSNSIGEAISRLIEANGFNVIRANYYSDSGLNIAKAIWGMKMNKSEMPNENATLSEKADFMGKSYAYGVSKSSENEEILNEIKEINKHVFGRSNEEISELYDLGKKWSIAYFESLYKKLGSSFDWIIGESEVAEDGKKIVLEFLEKGIFEKSDGAVVFRGEKYNPKLHTRVFLNGEGLPTYEAKELGLTQKKFDLYRPNKSIVITGNEQNEYFNVVIEALRQIIPEASSKTHHISHGMMRLPSGKISSRTGTAPTAESLINTVAEEAQKIIETSGRSVDSELAEKVAIGAIKFSILRQHPGKDIIFDINKSVSFEGDSGPYLMYTHARANSLLEKGRESGVEPIEAQELFGAKNLMRLLARFEDVVARAGQEYSPNHLVEYLLEICGAFNSWYAVEQMITEDKNTSAQKLFIVNSFKATLAKGLNILAIAAPDRM